MTNRVERKRRLEMTNRVTLQRNGTIAVDGIPKGTWARDYIPVNQDDYQLRWLANLGGFKILPRKRRRDLVAAISKSLGLVA